MKKIKALCASFAATAALSLVISCQSSPQQQDTNDTTNSKKKIKRGKITKRTQDGCYAKVSGQQMKDTLFVKLHVENDKVSGDMMETIFEKDRRKGTISGTIEKDNIIKATWTFMQEGMTDSMKVAFRLTHAGLMQQPLKVDAATGRQVPDTSSPYSILLKPADCNK
ncbi:hypothetical protein [Mucilaginibacter aquatilis]|uniref:Uncharacterized protein n=1 Tax=Mucilaginibacter aquatilis TaxID=1517760 RepID=A0A6I4I4B1_9SPHI|nr:hypothetical protein [Mucilaginibacter aquatilis]MVN89597.1 hypothetical protein [Mucilaginibacter aquatilis]